LAGNFSAEQGHEDVRQRADGGRVEQGADADRAAEQPADQQDDGLDPGAHDAQRVTAGREAGHQPVARAGSETRADVHAGGHAVQHDRGHHHGGTDRERVWRRDHGQDRVDDRPDHHHVAQRAEAGALAQRDPQQQHRRAHNDDPRPGGHPGPPGQSLVQDIPRIKAQPGQQQHGVADPVQHQPGEQLDEATRHAATIARLALHQ
jgi:hypothetical protein